MFHRFRAKINYAVSIAASGMVLIYMIVIFLLYSGFLRQDYLQKVIHTGSILSQSIEAHLSNIEEAALLLGDAPEAPGLPDALPRTHKTPWGSRVPYTRQ